MKTFTELAVDATAPLLASILQQPFLQELALGTLAQERFVRYIQQDALYLGRYAQTLLMLAAKAPTVEAMLTLADFGKDAVFVERQLHEQFLASYQAGPAPHMGAACMAYTSFLTAQVATRPFGIGMAAVLPCFKVYTDVGHALLSIAIKPNPYQPWLDTYAAPEFEALTQRACTLADEAFANASPQEQAEMLTTYQNGARMEYWFWLDAYASQDGFLY
jgi:thiaminase (transcriptional activator TenA)